jgi:hypothetical protein
MGEKDDFLYVSKDGSVSTSGAPCNYLLGLSDDDPGFITIVNLKEKTHYADGEWLPLLNDQKLRTGP